MQEASDYFGWGDATNQAGEVTLEPGNWSLDNFGEILVATVKNNKIISMEPEQCLGSVNKSYSHKQRTNTKCDDCSI